MSFRVPGILIASALSLVLLLAPARSEAVRVATYNLRNYLVQDRMVEGRWRPDYPKPGDEKKALRRMICAVRPDILAVQEIGSEPLLWELRADLALDGLDFPYLYWMEAEDTERHLAVLSQFPAIGVERHDGLDFPYLGERRSVKRGLLEVVFDRPSGEVWKLFVVHLKSAWTEDGRDPESQLLRTREAEACRDRIVERTFDAGCEHFLVAGDFNDHPDSAALRRFYRRGPLTIGHRIPAADSRGEVWTMFWQKQAVYRTVDGFVASEPLLPWVEGGSGRIADLPGALKASDHRLIWLDL